MTPPMFLLRHIVAWLFALIGDIFPPTARRFRDLINVVILKSETVCPVGIWVVAYAKRNQRGHYHVDTI